MIDDFENWLIDERKKAEESKNEDIANIHDLLNKGNLQHDVIVSDDGEYLVRLEGVLEREHIKIVHEIMNQVSTGEHSARQIEASNVPTKIEYAPGTWVQKIVETVYSKKTYQRIFEEQLSDMRIEYIEAIAAGKSKTARWVVVRGHIAIVSTVVFHAWDCTLGKIIRSIFVGTA